MIANHSRFWIAGGALVVLAQATLAPGQTLSAATAASQPADNPAFTRQKIGELLPLCKLARSVGPALTAGVKAYLWEESDTHRVYFFMRGDAPQSRGNDVTYGEYRDEHFDKAGHILERTEYYIQVWNTRGRPPTDTTDLPMTRKTEHFNWEKDACTGSTVEWQRSVDGKPLKAAAPETFKMVRGHVTVDVPAELRPRNDARYSINVKRKPTACDRDFARVEQDMVTARAYLNGALDGLLSDSAGILKDGKASLDVEWPEGSPELTFELVEAVRNPPQYQMAFTSKTVGTMTVKALPADMPLVFKPSP